MSNLIRSRKAVTTAQSLPPPAQSSSAATAPALMDHSLLGPGVSQALASQLHQWRSLLAPGGVPSCQYHRHHIDRRYWCVGVRSRQNAASKVFKFPNAAKVC
ncbi:hypothetical protein L3X38_004905 [Prunus dulcis]|uniref:Uncharacterized protein n=1 Tax=Prunus dulcis TaxID=3755 RepID=A0AAD4ZPY2_PRUDU|nr:hypothetical protein L3X38_004905 [Prunus dulcis]